MLGIFIYTMTDSSKKWIEAAKILIENPKAMVLCPECSQSHLQIIDIPIEAWNKIDRHMVCRSCGARNTITMNPLQ